MYIWHWSEETWKRLIVDLDMNYSKRADENNILLADPVQVLKELVRDRPDLIRAKQKLLRDIVFNVQYSIESYRPGSSWPLTPEGRPLPDAYDLTMDVLLGRHSGRLKLRRNVTAPIEMLRSHKSKLFYNTNKAVAVQMTW